MGLHLAPEVTQVTAAGGVILIKAVYRHRVIIVVNILLRNNIQSLQLTPQPAERLLLNVPQIF